MEILARIDEWWIAFAANVSHIEAAIGGQVAQEPVTQLVSQHLQKIDERLIDWQLGPSVGGYRLAVSPGGDYSLTVLVEVLLARAPRLRGWSFVREVRPAA